MVPRGEVPDRFEAPWEPRLMVRQATVPIHHKYRQRKVEINTNTKTS